MNHCNVCAAAIAIGLVVCDSCRDKADKIELGKHWSRQPTAVNPVGVVSSKVDHPAHYGGAGNPYETIKVIEAWKLSFNLGNVIKYISRADHKGNPVEDLEKALWYLQNEIRLRGRDG